MKKSQERNTKQIDSSFYVYSSSLVKTVQDGAKNQIIYVNHILVYKRIILLDDSFQPVLNSHQNIPFYQFRVPF